ncbi:MAG: hypothetical protein GWM90_24485, partial [Gemmatimonadetes bacterium]|nr:hypothetical protein [Gemmatimonadota bacterium]NIQ57937.1 hypothetical protein [Gemmatimonadota bacterium]NIU78113.1 hypothetical protein [Gammaproteobacteria bacterium]NIX41510.1 hypothetical protein [Gemmatimonadota bacterium]NIX47119.1 hypothetical protein [Gemmatimonadota bacterium]
ADRGVLGRTVRIDGDPAVVVGVMPPGFTVPMPPGSGIPSTLDAWTPIRFDLALFRRTQRLEDQDSENSGLVVARLARDASPEVAAGELEVVSGLIRERSAAHDDAGYRLVL